LSTGNLTLSNPSLGISSTQKIQLTDENVYLSEPLVLTQDFGYYTLNGSKSLEVGKANETTLHAFLQGALCEEDTTVFETTPSINIVISAPATSGEIGSSVTATATWSINPGEYKWGHIVPEGVTLPEGTSEKYTGITYETSEISPKTETIVFTQGSKTWTVEGTYVRKATNIHPASNLNNDIWGDTPNEYTQDTPEQTITVDQGFRGYRKIFIGALNHNNEINSDLIRSLQHKQSESSNNLINGAEAKKDNSYYVNAVVEDKRIVWAIPSSLYSNGATPNPQFKYWFNNNWEPLSNVQQAKTVLVKGAGADAGE
jgi:hypothetical protein